MADGSFNLKHPRPSEFLIPDEAGPKICPWIEDSVTILSDGDVTCGLDDPHGSRFFGNVARQSLAEIFANPEYQRLREGLRAGMRCRDCSLALPDTRPLPDRPALPRRIIVEPTIRCNLRCPQSACIPNNASDVRTRNSDDLSPDVLRSVLAEVGDDLTDVFFFNYGDPFLHRGAPGMIADIRAAAPDAHIVTSTNGMPLAGARKAEELIAAGLDNIVFTISGMTQESYARYHARGRLETALKGMRRLCEARAAAGAQRPQITWRYLLFHWTDSSDQIDAAIDLANEIGVDQLSLFLTQHPPEARSLRLAPGTPGFRRYSHYIEMAHGYQETQTTPGGLYPIEHVGGLGSARWTLPAARVPAAGRSDGTLRLYLATIAPQHAQAGGTGVTLITPWDKEYRVFVPFGRWGEIRIPVPSHLRGRPFHRVTLTADDAWCPADGNPDHPDYRMLGVLTRQKAPRAFLVERLPLAEVPTTLESEALPTGQILDR